MASNGEKRKITPRQTRTIASLLTSRNVGSAAELAGVPRRTVDRWLTADPEFRQALAQAEGELLSMAARRLIGGAELSLDILEDLISNAPKETDRRLAAATWLGYALKIYELHKLEQRLADLEAAVYGNDSKKAG